MKKEYHILSLSGGKDSTALAFFMKDNMPEIFAKTELVFCDTECELPELYNYLNKIEIFLDKKITKIKPEIPLEHFVHAKNFLPHPANRWCTVELKTKPFQKYLKKYYADGTVNLYIGIRADEANRIKTATSNINFIKEKFPLVENMIIKQDIYKILNNAGIGLADFYAWKRRSGCYFCFFQNQMDWIKLYEHHPELFKKAADMEKYSSQIKMNGHFGWNYKMPISEMIKPENIKITKEKYKVLDKKKEKLLIESNKKLLINSDLFI